MKHPNNECPYMPTPEQIEQASLEIQKTWGTSTKRLRAGLPVQHEPYSIPYVKEMKSNHVKSVSN